MVGILADAGFKFQQKVVIYYLLDALVNTNLERIAIELQIRVSERDERVISLDFHLVDDGTSKYFEIKDQKNLHLKDNLKPIISKFYQLFNELINKDSLFILLHSSQSDVIYLLKKLYSTEENERIKAVSKILGLNRDERLVQFSRQIKPRRMDNTVDRNFNRGNVELRSIFLIKKIYKEYNIMRYGWAESTYMAIENCYTNLISSKSDELKELAKNSKEGFPREGKLSIELEDLLGHDDSFIDKLMATNKFEDRIKAKWDFYNRFTNISELDEGTGKNIIKP